MVGSFSFDSDYKKAKKLSKTSNSRQIQVDLHKVFERGIKTKNKDMQARMIETLSSSFNLVQVTIGSFKIPSTPPNSLIRVEACLINSKC